MNKIFTISLIVSLLINNITVFSQVPVEKSEKTVVIFGKTYYLHYVKQGQTFYSICNAYDVEEADIYAANKNLISSGLQQGTTIKIPVVGNTFTDEISENNSDEYSETASQSKGNRYIYHVVAPSETLFSLAQRYGVTISDIEVENPAIANNKIEVGQTLKIPRYSRHSSTEVLKINRTINYKQYDYSNLNNSYDSPCSYFKYNASNKFKVAVMLPLFINENKGYKSKTGYYKNTGKFYEFYYGLMLAAKQMKTLGVSIEFYLKDTRADIATTRSILSSPKMQDMDLIIGPVHSFNFKIASDFALQNDINIVAPFKLKNHTTILSNPAVFLANPSVDTEISNISAFLTTMLNKSVLIIHNNTKGELDIINSFKRNLVLAALPYENINEIVFKNLNFKVNGIQGVENALSAGLYNIIVVPSSDQVFITNITTKLNYLTKKYKIIMCGMNAWEKLQNIEIDYLGNLGFHYGSTSYVNNKSEDVKLFKKRYKTYFNDLPTHYAYMGYDIAYYFMNVLKDFGKNFRPCINTTISKKYSKGLQFDFNFKQDIPYQGFENDWVSIVKIGKNFELIRVN